MRKGERVPVGVLTDRDIVIEVVAEGAEINTISVKDIMSYKLITANENDDLMSTIKRMRNSGVRRIPITNLAGGLVGILSISDILEIITEQLIDIDHIIENEVINERKNTPALA